MYTVSTNTGLTFDTSSPINLGDALLAELTAHGGQRPISYRITRNGTPQHDGWIDVHNTRHDSADFLRDSVQELVNAMIIQAAYDLRLPVAADCGVRPIADDR